MNKLDIWTAVFIYFLSGEIVWTPISIPFHWSIWLIGQPFILIISMVLVGLTSASKILNDEK
jgi:hypothetical protein